MKKQIVIKRNDYELIYLFAQGDDEALEELITKYKKVSFYYIDKYRGYLKDNFDRKELYQLSLISLYQSVLTYNEEMKCSFSTYFAVVLERDILMYIRHLKREVNKSNLNAISLDQVIKETDGIYLIDTIENDRDEFEPVKYLKIKEIEASLEDSMKDWDSIEKEVFCLWRLGYSYEEIAKDKKLNKKKVDYIIQKTKKKLRRELTI